MHKKEFAEREWIFWRDVACKNEELQLDGIFESGSKWNERLLPDDSWNPKGSRRLWMNILTSGDEGNLFRNLPTMNILQKGTEGSWWQWR